MRENIERGMQTTLSAMDVSPNGIVTSLLSAKRIEMERRIGKTAFRGQGYGTPPAVAFICACFAKTSVIWIPMIYAGTSTQFHLSIIKHNILEGLDPTNRVANGQTIILQNQTVIHLNESVKHGNHGNLN
ncbi:unnamed protein product [Rotaria magnacalcarata]|uniref:Uncharacterized protein n=1 Tax=Rotaria magnacalcarata TaxID=392030 RepID=A0A816URF0_9BILA|nr:unnamed protein product [Rotaria magnacalcarata]CAF3793068.1 unnamed protein product [Rotaria magnacalcarata]